jgi:hypothetical protein
MRTRLEAGGLPLAVTLRRGIRTFVSEYYAAALRRGIALHRERWQVGRLAHLSFEVVVDAWELGKRSALLCQSWF